MSLKVHTLSMGMAQAYLLETDEGYFLVDAGSQKWEHRVLGLMRKLGRKKLRLIFITHAHLDHYGSASSLRRQTAAPIAIHHLDSRAMSLGKTPLGKTRGRGRLTQHLLPVYLRVWKLEPTQPDWSIDDGERLDSFGLDARIVHLPGHTPGSSCLLVENRLAFVGDLLSTNGRPHIQRFYAHDWSQIDASVEKLRALQPEWIYPGHGVRPLNGQHFQEVADQYLRSNA